MEDVIGGRTDPTRFIAFLHDWESILAHRVDEAVAAFSAVDGLHGLVLAGGIGRGEPWPLSDIDLLAIYDDRIDSAPVEVERRRLPLLRRWIEEGWWTGLDIGRLSFTRGEVVQALDADDIRILELLRDDRWYHSIDKGFTGQAVLDPDTITAMFAQWLTAHRFAPEVIAFRINRERQEIRAAQARLDDAVTRRDPLAATAHIRAAVKWLQTWHLERWGHRDNSLGRLGTRFETLATAHGCAHLVDALDALSDLDEAAVWRRLEAAPDWVRERHDRSWLARRYVGERVSRLQDARDTLRVSALYATRRVTEPPFPAWLSIPTDADALAGKVAILEQVSAWECAGPASCES